MSVESSPSFSINKDTPFKAPLYFIIGVLTAVVSATLTWATLSREIEILRRDLGEAYRVNDAQDKRFANVEADVRWMQQQQRKP